MFLMAPTTLSGYLKDETTTYRRQEVGATSG